MYRREQYQQAYQIAAFKEAGYGHEEHGLENEFGEELDQEQLEEPAIIKTKTGIYQH